MKLIRFDLTGGASGDMILGSLIALGADANALETTLQKLLSHPLHLHLEPAHSHGIHGHRLSIHDEHGHDDTSWQEQGTCHKDHDHDHSHDDDHHHAHDASAASGVHAAHHHSHRSWHHIDTLLASSPLLSEKTREHSRAVFKSLAHAEAAIHGKTPDDVHFHEVGAWDSIADIVGTCIALEMLDVAAIETSAFPAGVGTIKCSHGIMPNPAPATLRLLQGQPILQTDEPFELVTPTAAALLTTFLALSPQPSALPRTLLRDAFSFGKRTLHFRPNTLRASLYEIAEKKCECDAVSFNETLTLLETNLDDCNPQHLPDLIARLLQLGANDAWITPIIMKKGRPAFMLSVLTKPGLVQTLAPVIFRATPTFGIRGNSVTRATLDRRFETLQTPHGALRVKIGSLNGEDITRTPEFEDCAKLARENNLFPRDIFKTGLQD